MLWGGPGGGTLLLAWVAAAAWLPFSLSRLCCRRVLAAEMRRPSQIASYGAWQMVWQFLSLRLVFLASPTAARVLVALGQALQLGLMGWFLAACWRTRAAPEPYWNPPTVNVAVSTVAGIGVGLPTGFSVGCFVLALCLQLALVPRQARRACPHDPHWGAAPQPKTHPAPTSVTENPGPRQAGVAHLVRRGCLGLARRGPDAGALLAQRAGVGRDAPRWELRCAAARYFRPRHGRRTEGGPPPPALA